ncbi:MAG: hypothetical protein OEU54_07125 [Gemmatimonadota bacterium]|nr:hypothetical protein [Gemmatimonadota bacterium]
MIGRQRIETAALLLAVFIAGGLGGAALERRTQADERGGDRRGGPGLMAPPGEIPGYYRALDLTAEQTAEIKSILKAARPESDSILREAMPRLRQITRETREAIAGVLTEDQRTELENSFRRRRGDAGRGGDPQWRRDRDERGGPPTGRGGGPTGRDDPDP